MSRRRHIDTKNLVVCETLDDFSEKIAQIDSNVEDIVGYITSISRTLYPFNVENTWGIIGFNWDSSSLEILEGVPFEEEKIEHVEASGAIIDYDSKPADWKLAHAVRKGWGQFAASTIPFTIIPKLPDGYRITKFDSTFNLIEAEELELDKSDWSNLVEISNFLPIGVDFKANLEEANVRIINGLLCGNSKGSLYLKGDFSSVESLRINLDGNYYNNYNREYTYRNNPLGCFIIDDDNKNLGFNANLLTGSDHGFPIIRWKGEGTWKDEYVYSGLDTFSGSILSVVAADNYNIEITFLGTKGNRAANRVYTEYYREGYTETINNKSISSDEPCLNLTIDTSLDKDIDVDYILCGGLSYSSFEQYGKRDKNYNLNPIVIKGSYTSINAYNPYLNLANGFPEYDAILVSKLRKNEMAYIVSKCNYIDKYIPCPYEIDTTNLDYINIEVIGGINANPTIEECSDCNPVQLQGNNYAIDILPTLKNIHAFKEVWMPTDNPAASGCTLYYKAQSIKADKIIARGFYLPEGVVFETSNMPHYAYAACYVHDSNKIHFKAYAKDGYMNIQGFCSQGYNFNFINYTDINYVQIDERDPDVLKNSNIIIWNAAPANGYSYLQPIILTNRGSNINYGFRLGTGWYNKYLNPSFVFIYKASLEFMFYDISDTTHTNYITIDDIANIIDGIQPLPEEDVLAGTYTIRMKNWIYNGLVAKSKSGYNNYIHYIEQYLGYVTYTEN